MTKITLKLFLIFFMPLIASRSAYAQSCVEILSNSKHSITPNIQSSRKIGLELEVSGDQIQNITETISSHFNVSPSAGKYSFRTLDQSPKYTFALIAKDKSLKSYEIHSNIDNTGRKVYYLFVSKEYNTVIAENESLDEIKIFLSRLVSLEVEDLEIDSNLTDYHLEEVYTWEVTFINSHNLPEIREIILIKKHARTEVLMFINPAGNQFYVEKGLLFNDSDDAFNYVEEALRKTLFFGHVTIISPYGEILLVPESSGTELINDSVISREDFATEIILPPVIREHLSTLLASLNNLSEDSNLLPDNSEVSLGLHVNIEFNPDDLKEVVQILLKLNKEYERFRNNYQKNTTRLAFSKPLPLEAIAYLEMLARKEFVTLEDLSEYQSWLSGNPKSYWLNIDHIFEPNQPSYRPAVEIRIADSTLESSRIEALVDDLISVIDSP